MNCLIAAATSFEIAPFLDYYRKPNKKFGVGEIDVVITGIGLTAATYSLQKQVTLNRPELVIQAGIAGSFDNKTKLGEVVMVTQEVIADQGVMQGSGFDTIFDMKFQSPDQFPFEHGWLRNANSDLLKKTGLKSVKGISVNQVTSSMKVANIYSDKFSAGVESMEGAALHYVCLMETIPFIQLRGLSNYVGERDKSKWKLQESIENLNKELIAMLENF